jgi:hypothetical protein
VNLLKNITKHTRDKKHTTDKATHKIRPRSSITPTTSNPNPYHNSMQLLSSAHNQKNNPTPMSEPTPKPKSKSDPIFSLSISYLLLVMDLMILYHYYSIIYKCYWIPNITIANPTIIKAIFNIQEKYLFLPSASYLALLIPPRITL